LRNHISKAAEKKGVKERDLARPVFNHNVTVLADGTGLLREGL